jgi:hypothetical protein
MMAAALLCTGLAAPSGAQALPPAGSASNLLAAPGDASTKARARFNEGVALARRKDWPRAYTAFLEAWRLKEHPQIALNLGRAEIEIGKYYDATEHLSYCVSHAEPGDPDLKLAREFLAEAEKKVGKLKIKVNAAGALILVDNVLKGKAPLADPVRVDPGKHAVLVTLGEEQAEQSIVVETGASVDVTFNLAAPSSSAVAPSASAPAESAQHVSSARTGVLVGGSVAALVGVGVGAVFLGLAAGKGAEIGKCAGEKDGRDCATNLANEQAVYKNGAFWGFVGGGALALGTVAFLVFGPKPKVVVAPAVSSSRAGVFVTGQF